METSLNNDIVSTTSNTLNKLINLDNRFKDIIILHEVPSQSIVINDNTIKSKSMLPNIINKTREVNEKNSSFRKRIHGH